MKNIIIIAIVILLTSCYSSERTKWVCSCEQQKQVNEFIKNSIANANNKSDEEMEDVIKELRIQGVITLCHQKPIWVNFNETDIDWEKTKLDSCEIIMPQ